MRSQLGSFFFLQFLDLGASPKKRRASVVQITSTQAAIVPVTEDCDDGAGIDYSWMMSTATSDEAAEDEQEGGRASLYRRPRPVKYTPQGEDALGASACRKAVRLVTMLMDYRAVQPVMILQRTFVD